MLVKPARGLAIRDPDLMDLLPPEGREVPSNDYWLRRLAEGDVREIKPKPEAEADAAPAEKDPA